MAGLRGGSILFSLRLEWGLSQSHSVRRRNNPEGTDAAIRGSPRFPEILLVGLRRAWFLVIWRREIEIYAAEWAVGIRLAQDDGDLLVQRDAVAETGAPILISFDGLED